MKANEEIFVSQHLDDLTIEIFKLEDMSESILSNYQRHDFHQLIWFTEECDDCTFFIDFNKFKVKKEQAIILFPGQINKIELRGQKGFLFAIHNDIFFNINQKIKSDYLNGYFSNIFVSLNDAEKTTWQSLMNLILQEYEGLNRKVLMESYMQSFLFHLVSFFREDTSLKRQDTPLFIQFLQLADKHFITQRGVDFYAKKMSTTPKRLNEVCKTMAGITTKQYLQERLILEVKKEIILGEKTLKEISFDLGFNEPAYFTRFFRQQTSMSPKEFMERQSDFLSN